MRKLLSFALLPLMSLVACGEAPAVDGVVGVTIKNETVYEITGISLERDGEEFGFSSSTHMDDFPLSPGAEFKINIVCGTYDIDFSVDNSDECYPRNVNVCRFGNRTWVIDDDDLVNCTFSVPGVIDAGPSDARSNTPDAAEPTMPDASVGVPDALPPMPAQ
jgi:hypothetical protein